jgi:acyl carrier protein
MKESNTMSEAMSIDGGSEQAILEQLKSLVQEVIAPEHQQRVDFDKVDASTPLLSLPMDSLALMELMTGIEETFNIYISEEQAFAFKTVGDVIHYIQEKTSAKQKRSMTPEA